MSTNQPTPCARPLPERPRRPAGAPPTRRPHPGRWAVLLAIPCALATWACRSGAASGAPDPGNAAADGGAVADAGPDAPSALPPPPCALDTDCPSASLVCLAGGCTADPRAPLYCGGLVDCPDPLFCGDDGRCVCTADADCPPAYRCGDDGVCEGLFDHDPCVADADCIGPEDAWALCLAGRCVATGETLDEVCPDARPPETVDGDHRMVMTLPVRDRLPPRLARVLDAVGAPFRVLAGDGLSLELGIPGWLDRLVARLVSAWAEDNLAPWHRAVLGVFGDLDAVLATWRLEERLTLDRAPTPWSAATLGARRKLVIAFDHGERRIEGLAEDILGRSLELPPPIVVSGCGWAAVQRREMPVPMGALLVWVVDQLVDEATDGRFSTADQALAALEERVCAGLSRDVGDAVGFGVGSAIADACAAELGALRASQVEALRRADLGVGPLTVEAHGEMDPVSGAVSAGRWDGELAGARTGGTWSLRPETGNEAEVGAD